MERRLAAILAADAVGYSRLMGEHESATLEALKTHRVELFEPVIAEHHGRIVNLIGDGMLVEFRSVVDAVLCAVALQRGMAERNREIPEDRRIDFRIGVNLGDVISDANDIYGDGVNIAARLEGFAEPGGICISRTVYNHIKGKVDLSFAYKGEHKAKNITEPIAVYHVLHDDPAGSEAGNQIRTKKFRQNPMLITVILICVMAASVLVWVAFEQGRASISAADCTDHLGLPVKSDACAELRQ